jgi:predicted permease
LRVDALLEPFLVLFALIGLGVLVGRAGILRGDGASQLAGLVMHVTLPATIFLAVAET